MGSRFPAAWCAVLFSASLPAVDVVSLDGAWEPPEDRNLQLRRIAISAP